MNEKILFVDDDPNLLASYQRQLHKRFIVETCPDGQHGLEAILNDGPYAAVVSDYRMPGMDGVQFLSEVREKSPDTSRLLLTGYADLQTAIDAVNKGSIFRLLTKPCPPEVLTCALASGIDQYRLVTAERELLEKTLNGTIKVLSDVLSLINPEAFGRSSRISRYVRQMASQMGLKDIWQFETAAMLSQIGLIILPPDTLKKIFQGVKLTAKEENVFQTHPSVASELIGKIPRLDEISETIAFQEKHFDGSGNPPVPRKGEGIPLGARLLKVALDFDSLESAGNSKARALDVLKKVPSRYDPRVLKALEEVIGIEAKYELRSLKTSELTEDMILAEDVKTPSGLLLIGKGQEVSRPLLGRLKNFAAIRSVQEPIRVIVAFNK